MSTKGVSRKNDKIMDHKVFAANILGKIVYTRW